MSLDFHILTMTGLTLLEAHLVINLQDLHVVSKCDFD